MDSLNNQWTWKRAPKIQTTTAQVDTLIQPERRIHSYHANILTNQNLKTVYLRSFLFLKEISMY
jgi:hypothetical protein